MKIEFGEAHPGDVAKRNLEHCIASGWVSGGPKVEDFERQWTSLFSYQASAAVSSGTDAVLNACATLYDLVDAKRGDQVITPALSFIATSNAVLMAGFTPVFVDVEADTMNIDPAKIEAAITKNTKAIVAVHTMGKPCNMDAINKIAKKHKLVVIEDCAEAHGARYKDRIIGSLGDMGTFSFYIAHLICAGEGGIVSSSSKRFSAVDIINLVKSTRSHGRRPGSLYFDHIRFGFNSKMNDLEASVALEGICQFHNVFEQRRKNLFKLIKGCSDLSDYVILNIEGPDDLICPHAFSMILRDPKLSVGGLTKHLEGKGIHVKRNFGSIPTQHKAFDWMNYKQGEFPNAEYIGNNGIHMACHQFLEPNEVDYMIDAIHEYFK